MPKTRSKGGASAATSSATTSGTSKSRYTLSVEADNPSKLLILPRKTTASAKVVSLPHPRYSKPARYLVCPESGIYEFTRVAAPKSTPRSWLIETSPEDPQQNGDHADTQISKSADVYVASPIDPLFLVLPALAAQSTSSKSDPPKRMFLSSDDHFDSLPQQDSHLSEILRWAQTRQLLEGRMAAACDTVDAGDESMYRLNEGKLAKEILLKAQRMSAKGLPKSMEERFVKKALEAPVMSIRSNAAPTLGGEQRASSPGAGVPTPQGDSLESQSSVSTVDSSTSFVSEASTAATSIADDPVGGGAEVATGLKPDARIIRLQQLRVAFNFICSSYIPPTLAESIKKQLSSLEEVDFEPLDEYLEQLAKLREEAAVARSASNFSRKRGWDEEDEERAEKKRKKDEEEKRKKAGESRGVRDLKKANVNGMKKLSAFFQKK